jgi:hypothetical protein
MQGRQHTIRGDRPPVGSAHDLVTPIAEESFLR